MTWLALKTFFKKAGATVIKYWHYFALAAYTIVVYTLLRKNKNTENIKNAFKISKQAHKEEVKAINLAHKEELTKRNKIVADYSKTVKHTMIQRVELKRSPKNLALNWY